MALIKQDEDGDLVFIHGKYTGELLEDVANSDPDYVNWMYRDASEDLSTEIFHKLQDVMEENGISFDRQRR